ncbi:DEK C-terminal domain-containing protein [Skeletonema marinoi]|uniref:DEK C-terminal domain-containing protein n=1 Tax=Skeletonema marinoi TaxID=267567 RepID=A0AAD8YDW0_9STRA|nr:DEK C-terminal domain-containing protein [Skeletonema marinoi]
MDGSDHEEEINGGDQWVKGKGCSSEERINIFSLNGFGEPVFTGGRWLPDEIRTLTQAVKDYCSEKQVSVTEFCGGYDHVLHNKKTRKAWNSIAQSLPHRPVISVYRRTVRQFHGKQVGKWTEEETAALFRLVEVHGESWKLIENKLGRKDHCCRAKYLQTNEEFNRGKWKVENIKLLLQSVREVFRVPRDDMDIREINIWTLDNSEKIPWTAISHRVKRRPYDCYFKWRSMTKRSNKKALEFGLEPVPMLKDAAKFDSRFEYYQWKAEQDPRWRERFAKEFILPRLREGASNAQNDQREKDFQLLSSIVNTRASRQSEVSWHSMTNICKDPRERWEELCDNYAKDDDFDLPLWELGNLVVVQLKADKKPSNSQADAQPEATKAKKRKRRTVTLASNQGISELGLSSHDIRKRVKKIIDSGNEKELTLKRIRAILQEQIGKDLSPHKDVIKASVKELLLQEKMQI